MRVLVDEVSGRAPGSVLDDEALTAAYVPPRPDWLRVTMVSSLDGAATGPDERSGSLNNAVDHRVFDLLRATADAVLVGAGTARKEGYGPTAVPVVLVSRSSEVPERLRDAASGRVLLATSAASPGLGAARELLGDEHVLVAGEHEVDLTAVVEQLRGQGFRHLLAEGGPSLLRDLLAAHLVDELCLTTVPRLVAGNAPRITDGPAVDVAVRPVLLLEEEGTLLGRWVVDH